MSLYESLHHALDEERPVALATVVGGAGQIGRKLLVRPDGSFEGDLGDESLEAWVRMQAVQVLRNEAIETRAYDGPGGRVDVYIESYPAPAQLLIVGATHVAGPLSRIAHQLGYRVIITDARAAFASADRFPDADEVIKGWPQDVLPGIKLTEATFVALLSHDAKFDEPTLDAVLPSPVRYIGAIGSRTTQGQRFERLRAQGYSEEQLARIYGPIGLDLGGRTAEETALAIMAEVVAVRRGHEGGHMRSWRPSTS